ncbi:putative membrane protein YhdT [Nocardioides luteus]|uniref:Integral membrane protein n=1 Tax=Nocardioides luteus TaxID=1844 RepID=A0ABQ5SYU7_9ACTN|nr:hypothetical protein [Nocardioides luteus]MDR7312729.1 putative membrane protein YhdT [Nocardioides luteus]GGR47154.1 hypothetical protein GCM10010197_11170 [Nocardioides luteus]GLJ68981.1 hypothetical protein GCM10017579_30170 [Nocardioides luteus]
MTQTEPAKTRSGPHLVLLTVYAVFVLAAGSRSLVQVATKFGEAPIAYSLSVVAAATYVAGWFAIRRAAAGSAGIAKVMLWVELAGVVVVGVLSLVVPSWFPDDSVWSKFGSGYGFVPALLPILGLLWLWKGRAAGSTEGDR